MNALNPKRIEPKGAASATDGVRLEFDMDDDPMADMPAGPTQPAAPRGRSARGGTATAPADPPAAPPVPAVPPRLSAIEVTLTVELGSQRLALKDLLAVEPGQLFSLDRLTAEPVDILVNGRPFARGEVVALGDRFGVRLTELVDEA